jgi:glycosyltransferase involved in cell wall biosynthesis
MKIVFLCRSLEIGGAERQLVLLAKGLSQLGHTVIVSVFYPGGALEEAIRKAGIPVLSLQKRGRWDVVGFLFRLIKTLRKEQPQIIYGYLGMPNILTVILKPFLKETHIVWGIRASYMDLKQYDCLSRFTYYLERRLSSFTHLIIANSRAGYAYAITRGFPEKKMVVVPNGIDTEMFCPDHKGRQRIRAEWGIAEEEMLIGIVARLDPMKDHMTFLKAASILIKENINLRFVCVGSGLPDYFKDLQSAEKEMGLNGRLIWSGAREDMPSVYNALDILCSSSYGEGFPNVTGEAMACGVPCVVTDAGDSAWIVGDTGIVVPPKDSEKLAEGMNVMLRRLNDGNTDIKSKTRERIVSEFNLDKLIRKTSESLEKLLTVNREL